ncbi:hypothetical protein ACN47E_009265 [Coniothyrium glycines]
MNISALPAELRNNLYSMLLHDDATTSVGQASSNLHALFVVSKQLHNESSSYFYQHNVATVDVSSEASYNATLLPPIPDTYLRYLRRIIVHVPTGQASMLPTRKAAQVITSFTNIAPNLEEVTIVISGRSSNLLNSRVDDSILDKHHPITMALWQLLSSNTVKLVRLEMTNSWFATGVAHTFVQQFGAKLQFVNSMAGSIELTALEKPLTGRYSNVYLYALGLDDDDIACSNLKPLDSSVSPSSTFPSSIYSALSNLDTFSVSTSEPASEYEMQEQKLKSGPGDDSNEPFFSQDDIEDWQCSTQDFDGSDTGDTIEMDDLDDSVDEDMEDIPVEDVKAIIHNLEQAAHDKACADDVTYLTNFAPDLLLARHQLGHLV